MPNALKIVHDLRSNGFEISFKKDELERWSVRIDREFVGISRVSITATGRTPLEAILVASVDIGYAVDELADPTTDRALLDLFSSSAAAISSGRATPNQARSASGLSPISAV